MSKESYYFSHDSNARSDPKCSALINDFGMEGYGFYWSLIEIMHEQGGKIQKFPRLMEGLSFQLKISIEAASKQIEALLRDYELLQEDEKYIWSERVLRNLEARKIKQSAKVEAGRLGGKKSGLVRSGKISEDKNEADLEANEADLEANEQKESKIKEKKVKEYTSDFETFWIAYPRPVDKSRAFKSWNARLANKAKPEDMIQAAKNYFSECMEKRTEERYIKHPATFLGPDWVEWLEVKQHRQEPLELSL